MVMRITTPTRIPTFGGKFIDEFIGRLNTREDSISVARMVSPPGWSEPAQVPEFDEVTIVLRGTLRVEHAGGAEDVRAGEVIFARAGQRVRYRNPFDAENEYWAICVPAFSPDTVHREALA